MASQTITLTNAYLDGGVYRSTVPSFEWAEFDNPPTLETWADWTDWPYTNEFAGGFTVTLLDSLDSVDFRRPIINYGILGDISVTLDISQTGSFSGEETTIEFTLGQSESYVQGRYYRWTLSVTPNSDYPIPALGNIRTAYNTQQDVEYFNDLELASLVDSTGIKTVPTTIGLVRNVQGTALQGDFYVDEGYFIVEQNSDSGYVRDQVTVINDGITTVASTQFPGYTAGDYGVDTDNNTLSITNFQDTVYDFTGDFTVEFWMNSDIATSNNVRFICAQATGSNATISISHEDGGLRMTWRDGSTNYATASNTGILSNDTWHHVAFVGSAGESVQVYVDGVNETSTTNTFVSGGLVDSTDKFFIGSHDAQGDGTADGSLSPLNEISYQGYLQWFRISNSKRYTSAFTPHTVGLVNDPDTVLLIQNTADLPGENYGTDNYIVRQQGGSVVVESKNPLRVKTVDYDGNEWDGTVDLVVRGLKTIKQNERGVS